MGFRRPLYSDSFSKTLHKGKSFSMYTFLSSVFFHKVVILRFESHPWGSSTNSPFFFMEQHYVCSSLLIQSRVDEHLGYCQPGAVTNKAAMSIVPTSPCRHMFSFVQGTRSDGMNRLFCRCTFKFLGNRKAVFQGACVILCSHQQCMSSRSPTPQSMLGTRSSSLFLPCLKCGSPVWFLLFFFLICISSPTNEVEPSCHSQTFFDDDSVQIFGRLKKKKKTKPVSFFCWWIVKVF